MQLKDIIQQTDGFDFSKIVNCLKKLDKISVALPCLINLDMALGLNYMEVLGPCYTCLQFYFVGYFSIFDSAN